MNISQKIKNIFIGILMILGGLFIELYGEDSVPLIIFFYSIALLLSGIKYFYYYLSMARHMVGGQIILCKAFVLLDLACFLIFSINVPTNIIIFYLIAIHFFSGFVQLFGAMDAKRLGASYWRVRFFLGLYNTIISIMGLFSFQRPSIMVTIYVIGVITTGIAIILNCLRKTENLYIT